MEHGATTYLGVRVPTETHDRLRELAESEHRTVSQEVRRLIDQRLAEQNDEPVAA